MKKIAAIAFGCACMVFASCAKVRGANSIVVGATPIPHAEILNLVKDDLAAAGYHLAVQEFTDYVTLNDVLESGEIDANYYQHLPYMEATNTAKGYHLVSAAAIHIEPFALYSKKITDLAALPEKSTVAIPNDPTNGGRALLLLHAAGLLTLKEGVGVTASVLDIVENPKNIKIKEIDAASLPRVLNDVTMAAINGNFAIPAGLNPYTDSLFVEGKDSPYANIVAVKAGNEDTPAIQALVRALQSPKVKQYIEERYPNGEVVAAF